MKLQRGFGGVELCFVIIALVGLGGWIANIVKLADMDFDHVTGMMVVRAFGVFIAPLGAVLGFI